MAVYSIRAEIFIVEKLKKNFTYKMPVRRWAHLSSSVHQHFGIKAAAIGVDQKNFFLRNFEIQ